MKINTKPETTIEVVNLLVPIPNTEMALAHTARHTLALVSITGWFPASQCCIHRKLGGSGDKATHTYTHAHCTCTSCFFSFSLPWVSLAPPTVRGKSPLAPPGSSSRPPDMSWSEGARLSCSSCGQRSGGGGQSTWPLHPSIRGERVACWGTGCQMLRVPPLPPLD